MSGELAFIAQLRRLTTHAGARGLNDDCAVLVLGRETLILTHDMIAEGVHFLPGQDPADVAWRLVASNISDLAAKGAEPLGVLLGYTLSKNRGGTDEADAHFLVGLDEALAYYRAPLLGGDTIATHTAPTHGLTAIGRATHTPVPSRGGARGGDDIWLTGPLGAAMLGLEALKAGADAALSEAYRRPRALLDEGQALAPLVTAMIDVSDGLLLDATRMADASGVCMAIDSSAVPIATPEARRAEALRWGDDYQLLFTLPGGTTPPIPAHRIGTVRPRGGTPLLLDGAALPEDAPLGFRH